VQGALSHPSHYNRIPASQFQPNASTKLTRFASIMQYLQETVTENDLEQRIAVGVRVLSADWDNTLRSWNLVLSFTDKNGAKTERGLRCSMLYMCSGYFSYDTPHDPALPGFAKFKGTVLHPQFWPEPSPSLADKQVNSHSFLPISPRALLF
jgi:monooxygenase